MKKYEILMGEENTIEFEGRTLHRIRALKDFKEVKKGELGGFVEKGSNLSQEGGCWIYDDAKAMDDSRIYNNSKMYGNSRIYDNSKMYDNSRMYGESVMYNNSAMHNNSEIYGNSIMYDDSEMYGYSRMYNDSELHNKAKLCGKLFSKVDDFVEINNPEGRLVTCIRKDDKIFYTVGCQYEIDEETFIWRIEHKDSGIKKNPHRKYYYKIIEASKILLLNK